jgi:hypothetical protein
LIFAYLLSRLGYAKVPDAAVCLASQVNLLAKSVCAGATGADAVSLLRGATALEKLLRSCKAATQ